jgi:hypothetical protein
VGWNFGIRVCRDIDDGSQSFDRSLPCAYFMYTHLQGMRVEGSQDPRIHRRSTLGGLGTHAATLGTTREEPHDRCGRMVREPGWLLLYSGEGTHRPEPQRPRLFSGAHARARGGRRSRGKQIPGKRSKERCDTRSGECRRRRSSRDQRPQAGSLSWDLRGDRRMRCARRIGIRCRTAHATRTDRGDWSPSMPTIRMGRPGSIHRRRKDHGSPPRADRHCVVPAKGDATHRR